MNACISCHEPGIEDIDQHECPVENAHILVTEYTVSLLPYGHPARRYCSLKVKNQQDNRWHVERDSFTLLAKNGVWSTDRPKEPNREAWLATYYFDLPTALSLAAVAARDLEVNGRHVLDILKEGETS